MDYGQNKMYDRRDPYVYSREQIDNVNRNLDRVSNMYAKDYHNVQTESRIRQHDNVHEKEKHEPVLPALLEESLKSKLLEHPLLETIVIIMETLINSQQVFDRPSHLVEYLTTFSLFYKGEVEIAKHLFSLDPMYSEKLEEKIESERNKERRRQVDDILNDSTEKQYETTEERFANVTLDNVLGNGSKKKEKTAVTFDLAGSDDESNDMDEGKVNVEWSEAGDEDIQAFVDDRVNLNVIMTKVKPYFIKNYYFSLGEVLKID